jgi:hypothetical protein
MSDPSPDTNPYEAVSIRVDKDRRSDKRILEFYLRHRSINPTLATMIGQHTCVWLIQIYGGIAAILFTFILVGCSDVRYLVIGLIAGSMIRDVVMCRQTVHRWPLYRDVLNWERIEQQLDLPGDDVGKAT